MAGERSPERRRKARAQSWPEALHMHRRHDEPPLHSKSNNFYRQFIRPFHIECEAQPANWGLISPCIPLHIIKACRIARWTAGGHFTDKLPNPRPNQS